MQITQTLEGVTSTVRLSELASPLSQVNEPRPRVLNSSMPSTGANSPAVATSPTPSSSASHGSSAGAQPLTGIDEGSEEEAGGGWLPWLTLTAVLAVMVSAVLFARRRTHL